MSDLVRVRIDGLEKNVGRTFADVKGLTVLDEPTVSVDGRPRPTTRKNGRAVKPQTSVAKKAAEKKAQTSARTPEEAS